MQHIAVHVGGPKMFERTGHRLRDLNGETGCGIIRQSVVLTRPIGKFGLQKKIFARHNSSAISGGKPLTDSGFEVMPPLVGRVDTAKSHSQRQFGKRGSAVFLPGGAVEEIGKGWNLLSWHRAILPRSDAKAKPVSVRRFIVCEDSVDCDSAGQV